MKDFFLPTKQNRHIPHLLHIHAIFVYVIVLLSFNFFVVNLGLITASSTFTSEELLQSHNNQRERYGISPLKINYTLETSAQRKANDMLKSNCWSHYCPNGKDWKEYFDESNYVYVHAGENLAEGFTSEDSVVSAWMNSESHRENMLNDKFDEVGFGIVSGEFQGKKNNTLIVVHFGSTSPLSISANNSVVHSDISITSPQEGAFVSDNPPLFEGTTSLQNETILVSEADQTMGIIEATGSNYSFRPAEKLSEGQHIVKAQATSNSTIFDTVRFEIDTTNPKLLQNSVISQSANEDETRNIELTFNEDIESVMSTTYGIIPSRVNSRKWIIKLPASSVGLNSVLFSVTDRAGNVAEITVSEDLIVQATQPLETLSTSSFLGSFSSNGIRSTVAVAFTIYMILLLLVDFIYLQKTNMLHVARSKSHIHLSAFTVLLLVLVSGSSAGVIL